MSENKDESIELLRDMNKWLRFLGMKEVKTVLTETLNDSKKIIVYHHSDGKNTSAMLSELSSLSAQTVSTLWKEWLSLGLGDAIPTSGGNRFRRSFDVKMFGITVPEVKPKPGTGSVGSSEQKSPEQNPVTEQAKPQGDTT